ncbi:hypothetical protein HK102_007038, partial [Quaeritorhiza haematococci]
TVPSVRPPPRTIDETAKDPAMNVTVLGAGVIGLTTACLLQSQGHKVKIVARASPETWDTDDLFTSPKAGAHWRSFAEPEEKRLQGKVHALTSIATCQLETPRSFFLIHSKSIYYSTLTRFLMCGSWICQPNNTEWEEVTFHMLWELMSIKEAGLMQTPGYETWGEKPEDWEEPWFASFIPKYSHMSAESLPSGKTFGIQYETVCINVPKYMHWLLTSFKSMGGILEHRSVSHIDELFEGDVDAVVNCSGFGALYLGGVEDKDVYPTRGQTVLVNAPHIRHTITTLGDQFTYIIPREDGVVVLGGTYQANNFSLNVDEDDAQGIIERCLSICPELTKDGKEGGELDIIAHKVGLRPTRLGGTRVDCEERWRGGRRRVLVSNYGHGGY